MSEITSTPAPSSESASQVDSNAESQAAPKELTPSQKEKIKLKVFGEEIEEEIDWSNKEERIKDRQMSLAAKRLMNEAKEEKRRAFNIIKEFESNPESMLSRLGPKGREIAEKFVLSQIQDEMLSPEEKEYRDLKKYKEMTEAEKAKVKESQEKEASLKIESQYAQRYQETIIQAMEKSGLPKTPELVKRMAGIMKSNLELGLDLTPDDLIAEVKNDITALLKSIIGDSDGDHLINIFGKDISNKIRKADLKNLQEKQSQVFQQKTKVSSNNTHSNQTKPYMSMEEWKESVANNLKK